MPVLPGYVQMVPGYPWRSVASAVLPLVFFFTSSELPLPKTGPVQGLSVNWECPGAAVVVVG